MKKLFVLIAMTGLTSQQKETLKKLAKRHKSFLQTIVAIFSDSEDYTRANMLSMSLGAEVLQRQVNHEKKEKTQTDQLIKECKRLDIAQWRINLAI